MFTDEVRAKLDKAMRNRELAQNLFSAKGEKEIVEFLNRVGIVLTGGYFQESLDFIRNTSAVKALLEKAGKIPKELIEAIREAYKISASIHCDTTDPRAKVIFEVVCVPKQKIVICVTENIHPCIYRYKQEIKQR